MNKCWINKLHQCPHEPCVVFTDRQCFWLLFFFDLAANCCWLRDTSFYQVLSFDVDTCSAGGTLAWALVGSVNLPVSPAVQITNGSTSEHLCWVSSDEDLTSLCPSSSSTPLLILQLLWQQDQWHPTNVTVDAIWILTGDIKEPSGSDYSPSPPTYAYGSARFGLRPPPGNHLSNNVPLALLWNTYAVWGNEELHMRSGISTSICRPLVQSEAFSFMSLLW